MVLCLVALPFLAFLGLFSVRYRQLAKESFACVWRSVRFQPCTASVDERIRSQVTMSLARRSKTLARFVRAHFQALSVVFVLLVVVTSGYVLYGGAQYYLWGSCYGPDSSGFCVFDPAGSNVAFSAPEALATCGAAHEELDEVGLIVSDSLPALAGSDHVVFVGCYSCPYTREVYSVVRDATLSANRGFVFAHIPISSHDVSAGLYTECVARQGTEEVFVFIDSLFSVDELALVHDEDFLLSTALSAGVDSAELVSCLEDPAVQLFIDEQTSRIASAGVYGTPTVYIDDVVLVGPKPRRVYDRLLR